MLMRSDPFRELDRLIPTALGRAPSLAGMPMDAFRRGDRYIVSFDVPGLSADDIELTVEKGVLTVTAERSWAHGEDEQVLAAERPHGRFTRQVSLSEGIDDEGIEASYENGVLTVTLPVAEQAKARKVEITSGGGRPEAIEATSHAA